jgi:hypothetical protein
LSSAFRIEVEHAANCLTDPSNSHRQAGQKIGQKTRQAE